MKTIILLWIDDMAAWVNGAKENLEIILKDYDIELQVHHVENGELDDIKQKLMYFTYAAIIMDYHMEPKNGDYYIEKIRDEDHLSTIPIYFYSQDTSKDLSKLVKDFDNVRTVFRGNLEDEIREYCLKIAGKQ